MGCSQFEHMWYPRFSRFVYQMIQRVIIVCCFILRGLLIFITILTFLLKILIETMLFLRLVWSSYVSMFLLRVVIWWLVPFRRMQHVLVVALIPLSVVFLTFCGELLHVFKIVAILLSYLPRESFYSVVDESPTFSYVVPPGGWTSSSLVFQGGPGWGQQLTEARQHK